MAKFKRRDLILAAAIGSLTTAGARSALAETELIVTVPGGSFEEGWRKSVIAPFEAANPGVKVRIVQGLTFQNAALMRAQKEDVRVDVIMMDEVAASEAATEGLTHALSPATVPNLADVFPEFRVPGDTYAKIYWVPVVIAFNETAVKPAPASWGDLWAPRFKGKLAIPNIDTSVGLLFLLMVNQVNGGTDGNADAGFAALKSLKDGVVAFPTQHAQLAQMFSQGDIDIAPWFTDRTISLAETGQPMRWLIPKEGSVMTEGTLAVAKGTKKLDLALRYVNFALGAQAQAETARHANLSPVCATATLDATTKARVPHGPEVLRLVRRPDWRLVNQNRVPWSARWNREVVI